MGLFNRKKAAQKTEQVAAAVEKAADAVGDKIAPAVEKAADAVQGVVTTAGEKAADAIEQAAGAVKEKAAAVSAEELAKEAVASATHQVDDVMEAAVKTTDAFVEDAVVPEEAPAAEGAPSCGTPSGELTKKEIGTVEHVRMNYHAGYGVYNEWPNGGMTIHSGIGWFHPFGPSEYWGVANIPGNFCEEAKQFPLEKFFTEDWMENFETDLFCIYRLADGDIYAWDGMFAVRGLDEHKCIVYNSEYTRQDVLVNVIVGGTGRYEGARGLLIGTTEGGGKTKVVGKMPDGSDLELPETIMKDLDGYIRFPE